MTPPPEQEAREKIDRMLADAGWHLCDWKSPQIHAARGVAIREFRLRQGHGIADYLLYVDGQAAGVIEAKAVGATLTGVEIQSDRYCKGLPDGLPCWFSPLPFCYQSTGVETRFTNCLDPDACSRPIFSFHRPELSPPSWRMPPLPRWERAGVRGEFPLPRSTNRPGPLQPSAPG